MDQETTPRAGIEASEGLIPKLITTGGKIMPIPVKWNGLNESGWEPVDDKVLILPDEIQEQTAGGIMLTGTHLEREQMAVVFGTIIAVGPAAYVLSGDRVRHWDPEHPKPKPGDRVFLEKYAGQLLTGDDGKTYRIADDKTVGAMRARRG